MSEPAASQPEAVGGRRLESASADPPTLLSHTKLHEESSYSEFGRFGRGYLRESLGRSTTGLPLE